MRALFECTGKNIGAVNFFKYKVGCFILLPTSLDLKTIFKKKIFKCNNFTAFEDLKNSLRIHLNLLRIFLLTLFSEGLVLEETP